MDRFRSAATLLFTAYSIAGCSAGAGIDCLTLDLVRQYGQLEAPQNAGSTTPLAEAGVLGNVRGAVVGPTGELHVLDRSAHHVVVFDSSGVVSRTVRGGAGEGPGEFRLPMHIAATTDGFSVIDYDLRRLTEFDWEGGIRRTVRLQSGSPWTHVVRGDTAWIGYSTPDSTAGPIFHIIDLATSEVTAGPRLDPQDQPYGTSAGMAPTTDGGLLVNTARPGVWMEYGNRRTVRRGAPLYPGDRPPVMVQTEPRLIQVTPAQYVSSGLAVIADSLVLQGIVSLPRPFDWNDPPERSDYVYSIGVFARDGRHLTTLPLSPGALLTYLGADGVDRIFLPYNEPFPQLHEYVLRPCAQ